MKINLKYIVINLSFFAMLMSACKNEEFMLPPIGEPIPFQDPHVKRMDSLLLTSKDTLFTKVWKRSNLKTLFSDKLQHTVLMPSDKAMVKAGYTSQKISTMEAKDADSLVWFYTIADQVSKENLQEITSSLRMFSMLKQPKWTIINPYSYIPGQMTYQYLHYLAVENGKFLVNGQVVGQVADAIPSSNGYLWPISEMIPVPRYEINHYLDNDPRFSMFVAIKKQSDLTFDTEYRHLYEIEGGWDPGPETSSDRLFYNRWENSINGAAGFNTRFYPTNDAFIAAGFKSVEEVLVWNKRGPQMVFDFNTYEVNGGGVPSDTIISYHNNWGRENLPYNGIWGKAPDGTPSVFYVNDFQREWMSNYLLNNRVNDMQYVMPFVFTKDGQGRVQVQLKGSSARPATIIETINTAQGPIHVVDRLFIPKDFKLK